MKIADHHSTHSVSRTQRNQDQASPFFSPAREENKENMAPTESFFQPKLKVGAPDDKYEKEADQVADQVVQRKTEETKKSIEAKEARPQVQTKLKTPETASIQPLVTTESGSATGKPTKNKVQAKTKATTSSGVSPSAAPPISISRIQRSVDVVAPETEEKETEEAPLQRKPVFESDAEGDVQRKCAACTQDEEGHLQRFSAGPAAASDLQRKCCNACTVEEDVQPKPEADLQRSEDGSFTASTDFSSELNTSKGSGSPLPAETQSTMEGSIGADFSGVRVHTGSRATDLSNQIGAQAFTHGSDVYFNEGKYDPDSNSGQHLLAHELTHTVQQGGSEIKPRHKTDHDPTPGVTESGDSVSPAATPTEIVPSSEAKPLLSLAREEEEIQRSCRECEEQDKIVNFKLDSTIQRATGAMNEGDLRKKIVKIAKGEIGKVEAKTPQGDGRRTGADRLLEYFHLAAPDVWADEVIEFVKPGFPSWCGIFSVYAIKKAGVDVGNWQMGRGVSDAGTLDATDNPQPGDIGYIDQPHQHHCIIKEVNGDTIISIDGNSAALSIVEEKERPRTAYTGFFTAFTGQQKYLQQQEDAGASGTASSSLESDLDRSAGKGAPLEEPVREQMEDAIGADFSDVNVHTGAESEKMNRQLGAHAFTHGSDLYFNEGKYAPGTKEGDHLLAHELTHTVQQGATVRRKTELSSTTNEIQTFPTSVGEFRQELGNYADDYLPAYSLLSVAIGYDLVRGRSVAWNRENVLKGVFSLINPLGSILRKRLEERGVIDAAFDWIKKSFKDLNLTYSAVKLKFDEFWEEKEYLRTDFIDYNIGLLKRKFMPFVDKITGFISEAVTEVFRIVKDAFLKFLASLAKKIGGYDLLADLLGADPITGEERQATTADILRGILKLPAIQAMGGDKLLKKLEEKQLIEKTATWIDGQWALLKGGFKNLTNLADKFLDGFSMDTLRAPMKFINGIKDEVVGFVTKIFTFFKNLAKKALELIKEVGMLILRSVLNGDTPGFDLVKVILGKDPLTGEAFPRTATNVIGAFLKLLPGGAALFAQLKETGAIAKASAWIMGAIGEFIQIFGELKASFLEMWRTSSIEDLFEPTAFFAKIVTLFKAPVIKLVAFVKRVVMKIFEVLLAIMKFPINIAKKIIANIQIAFQKIKKDPIGFLKNLLGAVKQGFKKFFANIGKHLLAGVTGWLVGQLAKGGLQPPKDMSMGSLFGFALDIMEVTMEKVWSLLAKRIGQEKVDKIRAGIDKLKGVWLFIKDVTQNGISTIYTYLKEKVTGLWDMVIEQAKSWVITKIIEKVTTRLLSMLDPTGIMAVVNGFMVFFDTIKSAIEYATQMLEVVANFTGGLAEIASGAVGKAADFLEKAMAKVLPVALGFLANIIGLGGIGEKIRKVVKAIRKKVELGMAWLVDKAVKGIGKIMSLFKGGKKSKDPLKNAKDIKFTKKDRDAGLAAFEQAEKPYVKDNKIGRKDAKKVAKSVKRKHPVFKSISIVDGGDDWEYGYVMRQKAVTSSKKAGAEKGITEKILKQQAGFSMNGESHNLYIKKKGKGFEVYMASEFGERLIGLILAAKQELKAKGSLSKYESDFNLLLKVIKDLDDDFRAVSKGVHLDETKTLSGINNQMMTMAGVLKSFGSQHNVKSLKAIGHVSKYVDLSGNIAAKYNIRNTFYPGSGATLPSLTNKKKVHKDPMSAGRFISEGTYTDEAKFYAAPLLRAVKIGGVVKASLPNAEGSIDHNPAVSVHWNKKGRKDIHLNRKDWYSNATLSSHEIISKKLNSSRGGVPYKRKVESKFRGPGE